MSEKWFMAIANCSWASERGDIAGDKVENWGMASLRLARSAYAPLCLLPLSLSLSFSFLSAIAASACANYFICSADLSL